MGIIYIMLIVSLIIALFFLLSFFWATKDGQFDDDYTPSVRVLFDDGVIDKKTNKKQENKIDNGESTSTGVGEV